MAWLDFVPAGDGLDRLRFMCSGSVCSQVWERATEYRILWDEDRQLWRLDRRTHAAGG